MSLIVSRWSRRYALVSVFALVFWQLGVLLEVPRQTEIALGIFGFVLHMIFAKAYALVPPYFDRELAFPRAPKIQFPFVVGGTLGLASAPLGFGPAWLATGSAALWCLGVVVFVGTVLWTISGALIEGATGTGEHNAERRPVDRLANVFVPVALLYLLIGSYETTALHSSLPSIFNGLSAQASHILAAGTGALLVFALGFRLLPRFLGVHPSVWAVRFVLPTAAVGPVLIVAGFGDRQLLMIGAVVEAVSVCLFAVVLLRMVARSERRRIGMYGVAGGAASGVAGVLLGLVFAFRGATVPLTTLHLRLNVLGFLGLTIVGLTYQFYPPSIGTFAGSSDRAAFLSILGICLGLLFHAGGVVVGFQELNTIGFFPPFIGSIVYAYLVVSAFVAGR